MKEKVLRHLELTVAVIFTTGMFCRHLTYYFRNGTSLLNADISSEMVMAAHLNREHALFSPGWFYGNEVRILDTNVLLKPGLFLFPNDWHMARMTAVLLVSLLLLAAGYSLMRACHVPLWCSILYAGAVITPFGKWYAWNVYYNICYASHVIILLFVLALYFRLQETAFKSHRGGSIFAALFVLAFVSGMGGIRRMMICYVPLWVASVYGWCRKRSVDTQDKEHAWKAVVTGTGVLAAAMLGFLFYKVALAGRFSTFSPESMRWKMFSIEGILKCISDYLSLFGWRFDAPIMSALGVFNVFSVFLGAGTLFLCVRSLFQKSEYSSNLWMLQCFSAIAFALCLLIYGNIGGAYNESYWVPLLPVIVAPAFLMGGGTAKRELRLLFTAAVCVYCVYAARINMRDPYIDWVRDDRSIMDVSSWIAENDYQYGFAEFWNSNIVTELTDGRVEMWTLKSAYDPELYELFQETRHKTELPEQAFFLIENTDFSEEWFPWGDVADYTVYYDDNYAVFYPPSAQTWFDIMANNPYVREVSAERIAAYE